MTDASHAPAAPPVPATNPSAAPTTDAHAIALATYGYDLADYDWVPVRRERTRHDGWTPTKQRRFIEVLADTCSVRAAAEAVEMTPQGAYALRRAARDGGFARAWEAALHAGAQRLEDAAFERAVDGVDVPAFDRDGRRIGARRVYSDRMLMFLLRAHRPDRYATDARPATAPSVDEALGALVPPAPADVHRLMPPDALVDALEIADLTGGKLPHWLDDTVTYDDPPAPPAVALPDVHGRKVMES